MDWKPKRGSRKRQAAITRALEAILSLNLDDKTRNALLNCCLWQWTEVHGKYETRYISAGARNNPEEPQQHEHVHTRSSLIELLVKSNGEDIARILKKAIACTVTRKEHAKLSDVDEGITGWDRYDEADIEVWDNKKIAPRTRRR